MIHAILVISDIELSETIHTLPVGCSVSMYRFDSHDGVMEFRDKCDQIYDGT